ncbi:MAG: AMP-binding protein [Marinifilaceae bacterium]
MSNIKTYLLNHQEYTEETLLKLCRNKVPFVKEWERNLYLFIIEWFNEEDYVLGHTSGTTGIPKKVFLSKSRMRLSAKRTVDFLGLRAGDTALLSLSSDYIAGKMMIVRSLEYGLDLISIEPNMQSLLTLNEDIIFAALVPYQVSEIMSRKPVLFKRIRILIIGGAAVNKHLETELQDISTICYATYGMTETLSHIALKRLNGVSPDKYYQTMQGVQISQDKRNCLELIAYDNDKLITNDIVELRDDNSFEWLGRYDNIINSGGLKFMPEQIEAKIKHLIPNRYIITSKEDNRLGNRLILTIEGDQYSTITLHKQLSKILSKYEMPKEISFVVKFNETSSGKIIRK